MTQPQRLDYLLDALLQEQPAYQDVRVPDAPGERRRLLRALMNVRPPQPIGQAFLAVQDAYLQAERDARGVTALRDLQPVADGLLYLWQGDITALQADGIVNAANSALLGCFVPNHACIDNAIHSAAGIQLRLACEELMRRQGHEEPTGSCQITPAYNLPSRFVLHTVGPIIHDSVQPQDRTALASCYTACLDTAREHGLKSLAFCCISTGEYRFPNGEAARIAVDTVRAWRQRTGSGLRIVFNVFKDIDHDIYRQLLA